MGGQVQVAFMGPTASMSFIKAWTIRALAVTSETRAPALPDIPTVGELRLGSHVPCKSLVELRAAYMPDAARAGFRVPPS
jgi:tripartite-type tricarboxylate transporter receptor subunit TctC